MKKILALILSLCLLCGAVALAENTITQDSQSTSATVTYTITAKDEYTVVIPPSITIDSETKTATTNVVLKANSNMVSGDTLYVYLTNSANDFKLKDTITGNTIAYDAVIRYTHYNSNEKLGSGIYVLRAGKSKFPNVEDIVGDEVTLEVTGNGTAGSYADSLTFMVKIESLPN